MTRLSKNQFRNGRVWNGFDYDLQVWIVGGIVQRCGHPESMRRNGQPCCNAYRLAGQKIVGLAPEATKTPTANLKLVKR